MLDIYRDFFRSCTAAGLRYSIWKSLENFEEQLAGVGDIDVIFDPDQRVEVLEHLAAHHFIFDSKSPATVGPDVKLYRGFDQPSGKFASLHVHFHCRFGSKTHKECRYAHEDEMFRDQVPYKGILRLRDGHFFAIRLLTIAVREKEEDRYVREIATRYKEGLPKQDNAILECRIKEYFECDPAVLMKELAASGAEALHRYRKVVEAAIDKREPRRLYSQKVNAEIRKKSFRGRLAQFLRRGRSKLNRPAQIIITGPDGAGKSTVVDLLRSRFRKVGPCHVVYLGRREWSSINTVLNQLRMRRGWSPWLRPVWPLSSTGELLFRALRGQVLTCLGAYVVYDRSLYDNIIKFSGKHGLSGRLALFLTIPWAKRHGDLRFLLHAEPEVALRRKPQGKYTIEYLVDVHHRFREILPDSYRSIDSSSLSAEHVANQIVAIYFGEAVTWRERI